MYLTDKQYLELMKKIRIDLDKIKNIEAIDCTDMGFKHTLTNVGLCAGEEVNGGWSKDKYVTRETAMWPKDFDKIGKSKYPYPQQFTMKYRRGNHMCPFDNGKPSKGLMSYGCFYRCLIFQKKYQTPNLKEVKKMYDKAILKEERKQEGR